MNRESNQIFQGQFEVQDIDPHGKKFDRVSRIVCSNELADLTLDVNTEIYPLHVGDTFTMLLVESLDGSIVDTKQKQSYSVQGKTLADDYDYCMYGKVYKYDDQGKVSVYVSFGGLLMLLSGDYRLLSRVQLGQYLYLLIRK
jgi:DNA-directed RNA polymerase I, II, and III subunit RPABC3